MKMLQFRRMLNFDTSPKMKISGKLRSVSSKVYSCSYSDNAWNYIVPTFDDFLELLRDFFA